MNEKKLVDKNYTVVIPVGNREFQVEKNCRIECNKPHPIEQIGAFIEKAIEDILQDHGLEASGIDEKSIKWSTIDYEYGDGTILGMKIYGLEIKDKAGIVYH